jgi:hypothetical protein
VGGAPVLTPVWTKTASVAADVDLYAITNARRTGPREHGR